jgi:hypothetical protein
MSKGVNGMCGLVDAYPQLDQNLMQNNTQLKNRINKLDCVHFP